MRISYIASGLLAGALALAPMAFARVPQSCPCVSNKPTAASYTWNFKTEASQLLNDVKADALKVRMKSDRLNSLADDQEVDWQVHADLLNRIRDNINNMAAKVCRLERIRRVASRSERQEINRTLPYVESLARNADDAINRLNTSHDGLWQPVYHSYITNMYTDAKGLERTLTSKG